MTQGELSLDHLTQQAQAAHQFMLRVGRTITFDRLKSEIVSAAAVSLACETVALLLLDEDAALHVEAVGSDVVRQPRDIVLPTFNLHSDPAVIAWKNGEVFLQKPADAEPQHPTITDELASVLRVPAFVTVPLIDNGAWIGVLLASNGAERPLPDVPTMRLIAENAVIAVSNARIFSAMMKEHEDKNIELKLLNQIDRELMDSISLDHVFEITLDLSWRYPHANAAALLFYNEASDEMTLAYSVGYSLSDADIEERFEGGGGIAHRVARSGAAEIVPDVNADSNYIMLAPHMRSHMSVPVRRHEKVIAVIMVESRKLNHFNDDHQQFVEKLAVRAGVAIDNARLFADSVREREKLEHILGSVADVVIVVGYDDHLILINQSAVSAFRLYSDRVYLDSAFARVFGDTGLQDVYQLAKRSGHTLSREIDLHSRTYYTNISQLENIGWIIVMHDITPLKETEQLKSELLATVSHDLKQPLSIMNGYIELMQIQNRLDEVGMGYSHTVLRSIENMRRLIDDLLDFAKIESGVQLKMRMVSLNQVIEDCIQSVMPIAQLKAMTIDFTPLNGTSHTYGDPDRLHQIFSNLVGNAVKYTPPEGRVRIWGEPREGGLVIAVEDTGIGISPEDQARIFDRFYRVRRVETEAIEGTGLGLAIVKRLVDLHKGSIGVESRLGEGTTFFVTLPLDGALNPEPSLV